MLEDIKPGIVGEADEEISTLRTAAHFGSGLVPAYGTPAMIALMENSAVACIQKYLGPGQTSVGTEVCIKHLAASPVGLHARARATVTAVDGRQVTFQIQAWDDRELIGEGTHSRFVVDSVRFMERLDKKARKTGEKP